MSEITVQNLTTAGLKPTFAAASSGLSGWFSNNGHTYIHVKTSAAATNSVTILSQRSPVPKGLAVANITVEVSALGEKICGFFDQGAYNDENSRVQLTYATHTGITIAAISVT